MTMPNAFDRFLLVTFILLGARALPAAEPSPPPAAAAADQLKALNDPTIIQSNAWLDTEWDQYRHGAEEATWTLGGLWGWRVNERQDWAVRLKVPFVYDRSDEASGHADVGGFGDIEVATGTAFSLSNTWRTGGGIELHADTASNPALSDNVWRLHPSWSVAHDFTNWLSLTFTAEYNHSIATISQTGSRLTLLRNTIIRSPKSIMSCRSVISSCLYLPASSCRTIGRSLRITRQRLILKIVSAGLTR